MAYIHRVKKNGRRFRGMFPVPALFIVLLLSCGPFESKGCAGTGKGVKSSKKISAKKLFGGINPEKYLTGDFLPGGHPSAFVVINNKYVPTKYRTHYLRKEAASALKKMYLAFRKDHPDIPFYVRSSTRNFKHQKGIWGRKWNKLAKKIPDPLARARNILRFSSMPGTSRHHWGTDFDINKLENSYYAKDEGKVIYDWLSKNAAKFGFYQPYTAGRKGGYYEEKWHWSYRPLSMHLLREWDRRYRKGRLKVQGFPGAKEAGHLAPEYVNTINSACK